MLRTKFHSPVRRICNAYNGSAFKALKFSNNRRKRRRKRSYVVGAVPVGISLAFITAVFLFWTSWRKFSSTDRTLHLCTHPFYNGISYHTLFIVLQNVSQNQLFLAKMKKLSHTHAYRHAKIPSTYAAKGMLCGGYLLVAFYLAVQHR